MGARADAMLFYGYCEANTPNANWSAAINRENGEIEDDEEIETTSDSAPWRKYSELKDKLNVEIGDNDYYGQHFLYINEPGVYFHTRAEEVDLQKLVGMVKPEWNDRLRQYARVVGLRLGKKKPRWWLVADWG